MLRETSRIELGIWFAHLKVGSLDDDAADLRFAILATAAHNGPHFLKRDKRPYVPADFMLRKPDPSARNAELSKQIRTVFKGMGK